MSSSFLSRRGSADKAPASFHGPRPADDDSRCPLSSRAVSEDAGRDKGLTKIELGRPGWRFVDPEWNARIARLGGRDVYGRPIWRLTWGWNETRRDGMALRYEANCSCWLLLRLVPAKSFGPRAAWYAPRIEDGQLAPSCAEKFGEEYPWKGDYEIDEVLHQGPDMQWIEGRIRHFNNQKLASEAQRMRDDRRAIEAEEAKVEELDYENCREANPAFAGEPMVGYGSKSGGRTAKLTEMTPMMHERAKAFTRARTDRVRKRIGVNQ